MTGRESGEIEREGAVGGSRGFEQYYEKYWSEDGFYPRGAITTVLEQLFCQYIPAGYKCLDVGCGDGRTAGIWLREHGRQYVGVDISARAVREAQALGLDARKIHDASSLPFPDASFDAAVCIEVFEHLFQPQLTAAEIFRVLRPGGVLIATVPNVAYWRRRVDLAVLGRWNPLGDTLAVEQPWRDPHIRFFNRGALKRMLKSAGFDRIEVGGHAGGIVKDVPWVGKRLSGGRNSRLYRLAERVMPALFGYRLHAVAWKADSEKIP